MFNLPSKIKNILIITTNYLPKPSANGVCAYNIAEVLIERGYSVKVLCTRQYKEKSSEWINNIQIFRIYNSYFINQIKNSKVKKILTYIALASHVFIYPIKSVSFLLKMIHTAENILMKYNIDVVISFNNPLEGCLTGSELRKKYERIIFCVYDVDSFSNVVSGRFFSNKLRQKLMWHWERRVFRHADQIVIMENHEAHYNLQQYDGFKRKISVSNFPMLILKEDNNLQPKSNLKTPACVYLGTLDKTYRNPESVCKIFLTIENISLIFYGRTDTEEILKKYDLISQGRIAYGGFVEFSYGQQKLREADFLISIGNIDSDMIPSKTFEYISFGKPIIHFFTFSEDPVINYLKKYPLSLLVDLNDPMEKSIAIIKDFIINNIGARIPLKTIKDIFYMNTPEYSVDLIENFLKRSHPGG